MSDAFDDPFAVKPRASPHQTGRGFVDEVHNTTGSIKLYHITDPASAKLILETGFQVRGDNKTSAVGPGIYFARSRKDAEKKAEGCKTRPGGCTAVLTAEVTPGRIGRYDRNKLDAHRPIGDYDSIHIVGFSSGPEVVVFDPSRVKNVQLERG